MIESLIRLDIAEYCIISHSMFNNLFLLRYRLYKIYPFSILLGNANELKEYDD